MIFNMLNLSFITTKFHTVTVFATADLRTLFHAQFFAMYVIRAQQIHSSPHPWQVQYQGRQVENTLNLLVNILSCALFRFLYKRPRVNLNSNLYQVYMLYTRQYAIWYICYAMVSKLVRRCNRGVVRRCFSYGEKPDD
jgi:hypothetical protein